MGKKDIYPGLLVNGIEVLRKTKRLGVKNKLIYWECRCHCGNVFSTQSARLRRGIKSCGCEKFKKGKAHPAWKGYKEISGKFWSRVINNARSRNHPINIDPKYCWKLFEKQMRKCALSGIELEIPDNSGQKNNASIDRINCSKGYVKGNVQWVDKGINMMKRNLSDSEFITVCKAVVNHNEDV